ncbi:hypothetical protein [Nocardia sp. NPDC050406]|uniref:hypothetical protein n=1 Tax=Nocardia sp. NPDC050406 TaxID=3364318 RepID=UPI0037A524D7
MKPKRFGAPTMLSAVALAAVGMQASGAPGVTADPAALTSPVDESTRGATTEVAAVSATSGAADNPSDTSLTGATEFVPGHGSQRIWDGDGEFHSSATVIDAAQAAFTREAGASEPSAVSTLVADDSGAAEFDLGATDFGGPRVESFGDWPSVDRTARFASTCSVIPSVSLAPLPGIADIGDPTEIECGPLGIDTLRYSIPGPTRGIDPGPPILI